MHTCMFQSHYTVITPSGANWRYGQKMENWQHRIAKLLLEAWAKRSNPTHSPMGRSCSKPNSTNHTQTHGAQKPAWRRGHGRLSPVTCQCASQFIEMPKLLQLQSCTATSFHNDTQHHESLGGGPPTSLKWSRKL